MARFDAADTNHDQVLTSEERMAADIPKDQSEDDADGDIANATEAAATNQSGRPRSPSSPRVQADPGGAPVHTGSPQPSLTPLPNSPDIRFPASLPGGGIRTSSTHSLFPGISKIPSTSA